MEAHGHTCDSIRRVFAGPQLETRSLKQDLIETEGHDMKRSLRRPDVQLLLRDNSS